MSAPQKTNKLTKKQKKGISFRQRRSGKGDNRNGTIDPEAHDIPILEDEDTSALEGDIMEMEKVVESEKPKSTSQVSSGGGQVKGQSKAAAEDVGKSKKRRRNTEDDALAENSPASKRKKSLEDPKQKVESTAHNTTKQRFILFLGNLKYTTSVDAIKNHFCACDPPPEVRLLTPKSNSGKSTAKSKGCAFLEFKHRNALQQGLKLHHSSLEGRMINVELTAGGGGNSEKRLEKLKERNKQLLGRRREHPGEATAEGVERPKARDKRQRYSTTSGIGQKPAAPRTWAVGITDEEGTHRGGKKHKKHLKSRSSGRAWGTGVNAIPVG